MKFNLKFRRKSSEADASGAETKSSAKASKRRSNSDGGGIKALLVSHVEKLLLVLAILLAGYLVYAGYQSRGDTRGKRPEQLVSTVDNANRVLISDTWRNAEEYLTPKLELGARAKQTLRKMPDSAYSIRHSIFPPVVPEDRKRGDAVLFPVEQLEARTGYGALSLQAERSEEMDGQRPQVRRTAVNPDEERRPLRDAQTRFPSQRGGMRGKLKSTYFACVTGLVPYKRQWEAYRDAFLDAGGIDPSRDLPRYIYFYVERADVLPDGQLSKWTRLKTNAARKEEKRWRPVRPVSDEMYLDPTLTRPIPPVILRDLSSVSRHSQVPTFEDGRRERMMQRRRTRGDDKEGDGKEGDADAEEDVPGVMSDLSRGGGAMGMGGGYGEGGYGEGGYGEGGYGEGGYGMGGMGMGGMPAMGGEGMYGGGGEGGRGGGRGGLAGTGEGVPEWRMFRFYDFTVKPGRTYRYRVQLLLEDPNNPNPAKHQAPPARYLERSVSDRLALLPKPKPDGRNRVFWRETDWSEPSTPVTTISGHEVLMGESKPAEMRSITDPNTRRKVYFPRTGVGPSAKVMAKAWDPQRHTDVAIPVDVYRGSWPMVTEDLWIVDAEQGAASLLKVPEYTVTADTLVLDIRGGTPLEDSPWRAPGESLVMDAQGNLVLRNEIGDLDEFTRWDFPPDPREEAASQRGAAEGRFGGYGEGMFGGEGGGARRSGTEKSRKNRKTRGNR